jgi:hypothetical protein
VAGRAHRDQVRRAANEIDQLLSVDPGSKGKPFALAALDTDSVTLLIARTTALPEDLRWFRCGPLEVFLTAHEEDCMAIALHVRSRRN